MALAENIRVISSRSRLDETSLIGLFPLHSELCTVNCGFAGQVPLRHMAMSQIKALPHGEKWSK